MESSDSLPLPMPSPVKDEPAAAAPVTVKSEPTVKREPGTFRIKTENHQPIPMPIRIKAEPREMPESNETILPDAAPSADANANFAPTSIKNEPLMDPTTERVKREPGWNPSPQSAIPPKRMRISMTKNYRCSRAGCSKAYAAQRSLEDHVRYAHDMVPKPFKCKKCKFAAVSQGKLQSHVNNKHAPRKYPCPKDGCNYRGRTQGYLAVHDRSKHQQPLRMPPPPPRSEERSPRTKNGEEKQVDDDIEIIGEFMAGGTSGTTGDTKTEVPQAVVSNWDVAMNLLTDLISQVVLSCERERKEPEMATEESVSLDSSVATPSEDSASDADSILPDREHSILPEPCPENREYDPIAEEEDIEVLGESSTHEVWTLPQIVMLDDE